MSEELEAAKQFATHPLTWGVGMLTTALSWVGNKLWRALRHEIADMKQTTSLLAAVVEKKADSAEVDAAWKELEKRRDIEAKLFDLLREHEQHDRDRFDKQEADSRDRHDELMRVIGDMRADIAGLK